MTTTMMIMIWKLLTAHDALSYMHTRMHLYIYLCQSKFSWKRYTYQYFHTSVNALSVLAGNSKVWVQIIIITLRKIACQRWWAVCLLAGRRIYESNDGDIDGRLKYETHFSKWWSRLTHHNDPPLTKLLVNILLILTRQLCTRENKHSWR